MIKDTSLAAYDEILPELGERQLEVYRAFQYLKYATNSMVTKYLKLPINCITGRCKELRDKGLVEQSHVSWCPVTKHKATYWKLKGGNE